MALKNRRVAVIAAVALAAVAALILFLGVQPKFHWSAFSAALSSADPGLLGAAAIVMLLTYLGRALRWRVLMQPVCPSPSVKRLLSATAIGFTAVVMLGRPGELVRPWLIARQHKVPVSSQLAAWFLERVLDLLIVLLLFGFALTNVSPASAGPNLRVILASGGALALGIGIACVVILGTAALANDLARRLAARLIRFAPLRLQGRLTEAAGSFLDGMQSIGSTGSLTVLLLYSIAEWGVILAGMHLALKACPATADFSWVDTAVFSGFVAFGAAVQLPGIGGGMQVAAMLVLTELYGVALEPATAIALLLWVLSWLTIVPFGIALALAEGLQWSSLRQLREQPGEG